MQYIEVFHWGMNHIAQNHGFGYQAGEGVGDSVYINGCNVPTLADVRMLCDDMGMGRECIDASEWGVEVYYDDDWLVNVADRDYQPTGMEMWKKCNVTIGS